MRKTSSGWPYYETRQPLPARDVRPDRESFRQRRPSVEVFVRVCDALAVRKITMTDREPEESSQKLKSATNSAGCTGSQRKRPSSAIIFASGVRREWRDKISHIRLCRLYPLAHERLEIIRQRPFSRFFHGAPTGSVTLQTSQPHPILVTHFRMLCMSTLKWQDAKPLKVRGILSPSTEMSSSPIDRRWPDFTPALLFVLGCIFARLCGLRSCPAWLRSKSLTIELAEIQQTMQGPP